MSEENLSIADELRAAFEIETEGAPEALEVETEPEVSEPEPEVEATAESEEEEAVEVDEEDTQDEEPAKVFQPPEHWSSDYKGRFEALSPEAQELVMEFDADFKRGYQERVQEASKYREAIEPYKQIIANMGVSEDQAVRSLFATYANIMQDPANGVLRLAQNFGIEDQLRQQFVPETDDDFTDPEVKALRQRNDQLEQRLNQLENGVQQSQTQSLQQQIDSFANAKNESGEALHPHFDQVRHLMAPIVSQGKTMEEAYEQVVWAVPEYRDAFLKAKEEKKPDDLEKARKVKQAKRAAKGVKSPKGSPKEKDEAELTIGQELQAAWNELAS